MKNKRMQFLIAGVCIWGIAACGALVMSAQSQKEEKEQSALEEWIGTYKFLESTPHAAASDFFDTWSYSIEIYREKGEYYAALEFNGHMLWIEGRAKVCGNEERIDLIFEQYSPGDVSSLPQCQVMNSKKGKKYPLSIKRRGDICDTNYNLFAFQRIHKIAAKRA